MLPLWIIDLTNSSDRSARLLELLGQTKRVLSKKEGDVTEDDFCWYYSHYDTFADKDPVYDLSELDDKETEAFADRVYAFQNEMVADGQKYVRMIRHSTLRAYTSLNVCVLGDATEPQTQTVFSSIALFLQKEKGRMLANHVHQGMSIMGALFVPSSINSYEVQKREELLRTLMEVDVQRRVSTVRGYDHMLLYQDVQNRVDKYYTLLDPRGQAEFIYQCLIHLFYASNSQHPLISGVAAADSFYMSMGVASLSFDESYQDNEVSCDVANRLLEAFYAPPKDDDAMETDTERKGKRLLLPEDAVSVEKVLKTFSPDQIILDEKLPSPYPDPVDGFANKRLERQYFNKYLKNHLADYRRRMNDEIEKATRAKLEWVHSTFTKNLGILQDITFPESIKRFVERCNSIDGGMDWLENQLKNQRDQAGENKKRIPDHVNKHVWDNVFQVVDKKYFDAFDDYHQAYENDLLSKPAGHNCDDKKAAAIDDLCNHMKQETPVLSRIVRSLLLGVVNVLLVLPILNFISPILVDLGNIRSTAYIWAIVLFLLPALYELFMAIRYVVKRNRKKRKLYSYYLHDAYARMANRIVAESNNFYDKLMLLCEMYLQRCETIRQEINDFPIPEKMREELPFTQFNQPLIGGQFNGHVILTEESLEPKKININHVPKEAARLYPEDFFSLVHLFKDNFHGLFDGIRIPEMHPVEKEITQGTVRLLSADEVKALRQKEWEEIRDNFKEALPELIKEELVPLQHPSASSMLKQYFDRTGKTKVIRPFIYYAATNGEFVTSADIEQVDVKTQDDRIMEAIQEYLPENVVFQVEPGGEDDESQTTSDLFKRYIFLTRWDAYETLALNRILPKEDFDIEEQKRQVNEEARKQKKKNVTVKDSPVTEEEDYPISTSSAILWALCEKDNSVLWLELFHSAIFQKAREKGNIIYQKLTQKD